MSVLHIFLVTHIHTIACANNPQYVMQRHMYVYVTEEKNALQKLLINVPVELIQIPVWERKWEVIIGIQNLEFILATKIFLNMYVFVIDSLNVAHFVTTALVILTIQVVKQKNINAPVTLIS